jgi:ABC-type transport system substrate-binding protein
MTIGHALCPSGEKESNMKNILSILLILALLLVPQSLLAETVDGAEEEPFDAEEVEEEIELPPLTYDYEELVVGNTMPMTGAFFTTQWGNNSRDVDVRELLHAYNLIEWNAEVGGFELDPSVVSGSVVTANEAGDHTYNLFLYDDLYYSDGTPITAWDYAFSYLLRIAPQIDEIGGNSLRANYLLGYQDYVSGLVPHLTGVTVLGDHQLMVTISHEYLPFFFEVALLDCEPYPISVIAPDSRVADDGVGVYFAQPLNADTLRRTILDPENGYLSHPSVTSGPYLLTSYEDQTVTVQRNPYYKGNSHGATPLIERIIYKLADPETMIDQLFSGEFGLLNKVTAEATIQNGMAALALDDRYALANYQRSGLTFISFNTEKPALASADVRNAIALCLDKDGLVSDYVGNFGLRVDGYYGMGQWMYQLLNGTLAYPVEEPENNSAQAQQDYDDAMKAWEDLTLALTETPVPEQNIAAAIALLENDGWTLNRAGSAYNAASDDVRCKRINGEIVALDLKLKYPAGSAIGEYLEARLAQPLKEAGMLLTIEGADNLLAEYYSLGDRDCDMFYLASNFDAVFDPSATFQPGNPLNHTRLADEQLYELAVDMRRTEPGDMLSYCEKWLKFQARFNELEPMIPVYSNVYFDFYPRVLHDYNINDNTTWSRAIVSAYMSDIEEEEAEEEGLEEDLDGDEAIFDD